MGILQGLDPKFSHKGCSRGWNRQNPPNSTFPWFCISYSVGNNKTRAVLIGLSWFLGGNIEGVRQNPKQSPTVNSAIEKENLALGEDGNGKRRDKALLKVKERREENPLYILMRIKLRNYKPFKTAFSSQHNWISCFGSEMWLFLPK